jgi:hypothetical protein
MIQGDRVGDLVADPRPVPVLTPPGCRVRLVELAAAGRLRAPGPHEAAYQIWSALHGAVSLELKSMVLAPDPAASYRDLLETIIRGLAPEPLPSGV